MENFNTKRREPFSNFSSTPLKIQWHVWKIINGLSSQVYILISTSLSLHEFGSNTQFSMLVLISLMQLSS